MRMCEDIKCGTHYLNQQIVSQVLNKENLFSDLKVLIYFWFTILGYLCMS